MKTRSSIPIVICVAVCLTPPNRLHATIGETAAECTTRYGKPVLVNREKMELKFVTDGVEIQCHFFDGKCDAILFLKAEPYTIGEISMVLNANGGGSNVWEKDQSNLDVKTQTWRSAHGGMTAVASGRELSIRTDGYTERSKL